MHKNDEIEDFNVWEPKDYEDPNNPEIRDNKYLIWGENWEPLEITKITSAKSQKEKYDRLKEWRENNCDKVDEDEFIQRVVEVEKKNKRLKIEERYRNFAGLVLPNKNSIVDKKLFSETLFYPACYDYAIFTGGVTFKSGNSKDENSDRGYQFMETKFQGQFTFSEDCIYGHDFPFADAIICKDSFIEIGANRELSFKKSKTGAPIKEPFSNLKIEEGAGFQFFNCSFPEGFTMRNLNLKSTYFRGSHIDKIRFINCEFEEKKQGFLGPVRIVIADEKNDKKNLQKSSGELAVMYQLMKKSFEDQKDYQTAGKFYVSEMVFRQKQATGIRWFFLFLYGIFAGYGESIWRTGFSLVLCILFSILLYACSASFSFSEAPNAAFSSLLLFKNTDDIIFADILSRLLFIPAIFLFLNAIRRRLRRS